MVDHDRALEVATLSLRALTLALSADTCTHESEWPGDPEVIGPKRQAEIERVRGLLARIGKQIDTIDHYNVW